MKKGKLLKWLIFVSCTIIVATSLVLVLNNVNNTPNPFDNNQITNGGGYDYTAYEVINPQNYDDFDIFQINDVNSYDAFLRYQNLGYKFENKTIYLTTDLDLKNYYPCGKDSEGNPVNLKAGAEFYGTFNGLYHTIKNAGQGDIYEYASNGYFQYNRVEIDLYNYYNNKGSVKDVNGNETLYPNYVTNRKDLTNRVAGALGSSADNSVILYTTGYPCPLITRQLYGTVMNVNIDKSNIFYEDDNTPNKVSALASLVSGINSSGVVDNVTSKATIWNNTSENLARDRTCAPIVCHNSGGRLSNCISDAIVCCGALGGDYAAIAVGMARHLTKNSLFINCIQRTKIVGHLVDILVRDVDPTNEHYLVNVYNLIPSENYSCYGSISLCSTRAETTYAYNVISELNATMGHTNPSAENTNHVYTLANVENSNYRQSMATIDGMYNSETNTYNWVEICKLMNNYVDAMPAFKGVPLKKIKYDATNGLSFVQEENPEIVDVSWSGNITKNGSITVEVDALSKKNLELNYSIDGISYELNPKSWT